MSDIADTETEIMRSWDQSRDSNHRQAQQEADALPTHPVLGAWRACACGSQSCRRVSPSAIGVFDQGTGFTHDEARLLVSSMYTRTRA